MAHLQSIRERLEAVGQAHVLRFYDELSPDQRAHLLQQIDAIDVERLPALVERYVTGKPRADAAADLRPAECYPLRHDDPRKPWDRERMRRAGEELLRAGKVAAFTVAGGQGSRLGFDGPKGVYFGGAVTSKPLFTCLAEWILAAQRRYGRTIPWYIMTSPLNHEATVSFFEHHSYCGLDSRDVMFLQQGVMPTFDIHTGRLLLAGKGEIATNPDGHGGSLRALRESGALEDMARRGVEHVSYTQIDNPLVRVIDPVFLGLHAAAPDSSAEMSSKMVRKASPGEKVGVFCAAGGKTRIIEYSDMPPALAAAVGPDGSPVFGAGSIAVHVIGRAFIERLTQDGGFGLPFHRAEKKVPHVDLETGRVVEPHAVNAVKLEMFVFDALPLAERSIILETARVEEFAPIKNADGVDSPATCRAIQTERAARWLEGAGVRVPRRPDGAPDCVLEISPLTAMWAEDLRGAADLPAVIEPGDSVAL